MTVFNVANTEWRDGKYQLFMGQEPALYDSINVNQQRLFDLFRQQVSQRWMDNEFNHEQSRIDLLSCPRSVYQTMLLNLSFQWELDSVASRAIAPLFAPFVTNSELWAVLMENSNMEVVHALTYSEIVRQCVPNTKEVFDMVMLNENTIGRALKVVSVFDELEKAGAEYKLGIRTNDQDTYNIVFKGVAALYILERLQFMSSFAATFAVVEQGYFQSIGKAVQKIMLDEIACHAATDSAILNIEMATARGKIAWEETKDDLKAFVDEVVAQEFKWSNYLFSEGRAIVGLNPVLLNEWVLYNAQAVYDDLKLENPHPRIEKNPLPWMMNWIDIDKHQNAMQEADGNNYALNVVKNDVADDEELEF
jgi:ribonucleoside-diphosphate reductase beta chain